MSSENHHVSAVQTATGPLQLPSTEGIAVLRSPAAPSPSQDSSDTSFTPTAAQCQYVGKAARAAATGAGVILIINQLEEGLLTMTTGNGDVAIQCAVALLP
jgi:hypothetical protein